MAIPKIIHIIRFQQEPRTPKQLQRIQNCQKRWAEKLPGYEMKKWDETTFDLEAHSYTKACLSINRWDLIQSYVRAYALDSQGGIFLDNEMVVVDNFDDLLEFSLFFGFEHNNQISNAIVGAEPHSAFFQEVLAHLSGLAQSKEGIPLDYEGFLSGLLKEKYHVLFNNREQLLEGNIKVYATSKFIQPSGESKTISVKPELCKGEVGTFSNQMDINKRMKIQTKEQAEQYERKQAKKASFQ